MDPPISDETLFVSYRAAGSDARDAFAELAGRYERPLLGLARGILDGRCDAATDAVQDAWVRAIRSAHTFDGRSSFRTWLYRIVINACKDARQRASKLPLPVGGGRGEGLLGTAICETPFGRDDPDHSDLASAFDALPADRRLLLLLCYHHDLTHPQAAAVLGIPLGTLKSRLHAALTDLRARVREEALR